MSFRQMQKSTTPRTFFGMVLFALFLILSACSPSPTPSDPTQTIPAPTSSLVSPSATVAQLSTFTPSPVPVLPTATAVPEPVRAQYDLSATLNYSRHYLSVQETIEYPNRTGEVLNELVLAVEPNRYLGGFRLNSLKTGETLINTYSLVNNQLIFSLPASLERGQSIQLAISYDLSLPVLPRPVGSINAGIYGYSARQMNLVDWYPYVPPYIQGQGWAMHNPWYYGEHQVYEMADFNVDLSLESPPANLTIAAASQVKMVDGHYTYTHRNARNFTFSASDMYTVYVKMVGAVTVTSYAFPFDASAGLTALNDSAQALELYDQLFGAYPHDILSVVEVDFQDGMEYDGLYFLSKGFYNTYDGTPKGYLTMIGVHETAHQWWYARVANDQAFEPWLDEAMATYSELLFYSKVYPGYEDWWWSYRVDYFNPKGWVNLHIYDYGGSYPYRDGVYLRGVRFLNDVRARVGENAFFDFLKDYATREQNQIATSQDFFAILKEHTTADLSDLMAEYFKP
jgi:hypothetical protein